MQKLKNMSLLEIKEAIQNKTFSQKEVYDYFYKRIQDLDSKTEAFLTTEEFQEISENTPLAGIPIWVKDLYSEKWKLTRASSHMLEDYQAPYDATSISNLKKAGMLSIGKLNMDEFAMGGSWETSAYQITKNPWDITRIPGGSSSGSAASVAAGLVPAALGTDTGGSIRQPAAMCGVVGFKPTYGRISRNGVIAMASSLDTMGTLTKTVKDAGFLYEIMAGHDSLDSTSLYEPVKINEKIWEKKDLKGLKVGLPKEYFGEGIEPGVRKQVEESITELKKLGAEMVDISLPLTKYGIAVYYIIMPSEASTNLARYDGIRYGHVNDAGEDQLGMYMKNRWEGFGTEVKRRIILGTHTLSAGFYDAYFKKASDVRTMIKNEFKDAFKKVDIILTPTAPTVSWKIGEKLDDPLKMYMSDVFTVSSSLAGIPAISIPCGYSQSEDEEKKTLPVGLQLMGPWLGEEKVLETAHILEQVLQEKISQEEPEIF